MNYEVWLVARHPKTLESVATARVYVHADRQRAESVLENAEKNFAPVVASIRTWQPGAVISTEMRMTGAALPLVAPLRDPLDGRYREEGIGAPIGKIKP